VLVLGVTAPCVPRLGEPYRGVAGREASNNEVLIVGRADIDGMGRWSVDRGVDHLAEANESLARAGSPDNWPHFDLSTVGGSVGRRRKSSEVIVTVGAAAVTFALSPSTSTTPSAIGPARRPTSMLSMVSVSPVDGA
jgi:hypothetical protein